MRSLLIRYAVAVALLGAAYGAVPIARPALLGAITVISVGAIEWGIRRLRPRRAGAWRFLQASLVVLALADMLHLLVERTSPAPLRHVTASDLITLVGYVLLTIALVWLGRPRGPRGEQTSLIDAISLTLAVSLIVWLTLVRPAVESGGLTTADRLVAVLITVGYIAMFGAATRLVLGWRWQAAVVLLGLSLAWFLAFEIVYGYQLVYQLVRGTVASGGPIDLGYLALAAGCGAAALTPSMRDVAPPATDRHSLTPWRLAMIAAGQLVAPGVLIVEAARGPVVTGMGIASVGALVGFLILTRLSVSGRAYRAQAAREHVGRVASQAMVSAVTADDVLAGTRNALRPLLPTLGLVGLDLVDIRDVDQPPKTVVPVGPARRGKLVIPLVGSESALVFTAPTRVLLELADLLDSLADQAAVALQRTRLAEAARAEERERYFRTLVLTSTDAILISRDSRIEYATPSAETIFKRDVVGENFDDLVRRPEQRDAPPRWPKSIDGLEGVISCPGGDVTVVVHRRDLTDDPTVRGTVTTLRDVTAERALQRDLAYRASHDELTGMDNARSWGETLVSERDRRRGPGNGIAVIFIDIDEFKQINDQHGHPTGDRVLAEMGRRIREAVRAGDVAARVGGDEFAVLLRGLPNVDDARVVAQRLAEALAHPVQVDSTPIESKASIGLSYTEGEERVESLVRQADTALYTAKGQGKGRWTEYNPKQWAPQRSAHGGNNQPHEAQR